MVNRLITWVVPVSPGAREFVRAALKGIAGDPGGNRWLPFGRVGAIHFASLTLFEQEPGEQPLLVFESNIDGSLKRYAGSLAAVGRHGLDQLFQCDPRYPPQAASSAAVVDYLVKAAKKPQLFHIGHPSLSVDGIRGDCELRRSIEAELSGLRDLSAEDIVTRIRAKAQSPSRLRPFMRPWHKTWADPPSANPTPLCEIRWRRDEVALHRFGRLVLLAAIASVIDLALIILFGYHLQVPKLEVMLVLGLIMAGLVTMSAPDTRTLRGVFSAAFIAAIVEAICYVSGLKPEEASWHYLVPAWIVAAPAAVIAASYANIMVRLKVTGTLPAPDAQTRDQLRTLLDAEDRGEHSIYNHVAGLTFLRDEWRLLRRIRTQLALRFLNLFYRTYFVKGKLASIPTIHFAQWSLIDDRRLLFLTNYDGSADSYLDDFFDSLATGVAFIWYDTKHFSNSTDPRLLKLWVRRNQTLAAVRYRAPVYQNLNVDLINNNAFIRRRLLYGRGQRSARRWLRRFATTPIEPSRLARFVSWLKDVAGATE